MTANNNQQSPHNNGIEPEKMQQYISNELSASEQHALEMEMETDAFSTDAIEGLHLLGQEKIASNVHTLQQQLLKETRKRKKRKSLIAGMENLYVSIIIILIVAILTYLVILKLKNP